jgi:adenylate kinase family enzyme
VKIRNKHICDRIDLFMQKYFFIFLGRSGGGKGTQAALLKKTLEEKGVSNVLHVTTGGGFREFIKGDSYIAECARNINNTGGLQPEFLAVWIWSNIFINTLKGGETVLLDGAPRKPFEVEVLHSAIRFLGYEKPVVIYLDVTEGEARKHVATRGRDDDKKEEVVAKRMDWFETDILPTLDVYKQDPRYTVLHINGNQTIEKVHEELIAKISPLL